jgi:hypothetical protein
LKHLRLHVKEALLSPGGQHGILASPGIDISIDATDTPAPPITGAMLIEMAISAVRSARRAVIIELSDAMYGCRSTFTHGLVIAVRQIEEFEGYIPINRKRIALHE